jgi:hypothetical protein
MWLVSYLSLSVQTIMAMLYQQAKCVKRRWEWWHWRLLLCFFDLFLWSQLIWEMFLRVSLLEASSEMANAPTLPVDWSFSPTVLGPSWLWSHGHSNPIHTGCCIPTASTPHSGFDFCQLRFELMLCGFYQRLHCLYVESHPLDLATEFLTEALGPLFIRHQETPSIQLSTDSSNSNRMEVFIPSILSCVVFMAVSILASILSWHSC